MIIIIYTVYLSSSRSVKVFRLDRREFQVHVPGSEKFEVSEGCSVVMISRWLVCGSEGKINLSYVGFFSKENSQDAQLDKSCSARGWVTSAAAQHLLQGLEDNRVQLAVVSLEHLLDYLASRDSSSLRVLGPLIGGDSRALVSLAPTPANVNRRKVGAAHPTAAFARWEDISCAFDVECEGDEAEEVVSGLMEDALLMGHHAILELNLFWEGLMGQRRGLIRNIARARDYGIPEGFSHLILTNSQTLTQHAELLKDFKSTLKSVYQNLLTDQDGFAERWSSARMFPHQPDGSFLRASVRILAPHCEEFLRCDGCVDVSLMHTFVRWYEARVRSRLNTAGKFWSSAKLEHILCDLWH